MRGAADDGVPVTPCPCCGYVVHAHPPGSHRICPLCWWEDDLVQLRWPFLSGGANRPSLVEAQRTYAATGASELRFRDRARTPAGERRAPGFRPIDPRRDRFESATGPPAPWPADRTVLYWWRADFWLRSDP